MCMYVHTHTCTLTYLYSPKHPLFLPLFVSFIYTRTSECRLHTFSVLDAQRTCIKKTTKAQSFPLFGNVF